MDQSPSTIRVITAGEPPKSLWREVVVAGGVAMLLIVVLMYVGVFLPDQQYVKKCRGLIGSGKPAVTAALGAPDFVVTPKSLVGKTIDYPWRGMNYQPVPTRPVTGEVLLYHRWTTAAYLYLDPRGVVEHVAIAGT